MHPLLSSKIYNTVSDVSLEALAEIQAKHCVFTNGCFDILHPGHIDCLMRSKELGEFLIVGLNHDASVQSLKGADRPVQTWQSRAIVLSALSCVDMVIGFGEDTPLELIKVLRPDIATKGGDYAIHQMIGVKEIEDYGGEVVILPFVDTYSTTQLIEKL